LRLSHALAAAAFAAGALAAPLAAAQNCAGFTDVPAASPFCPSVEWMKNRAITTGCGDGTTYCPNDVVSRLAMAAFMNRLGTALTPAFVQKREPGPAALNYAGEQIVCKTDPVAAGSYPRTALIRGLLNVFTPNGGMDMKAYVLYTTSATDPATWLPPPNGAGAAYGSLQGGLTPPSDISLVPMTFMDLAVGTTYRFAVAGIRTAGTGDIANTYCENLVQLFNRNGTSSPFDAPAEAVLQGRIE
jgi:hypothetical protein